MIHKDRFRNIVEEVVNSAYEAELNLLTDVVELSFTYPDMPDVLVKFSVGGIFYTDTESEELH
jgi:hypothetical protein